MDPNPWFLTPFEIVPWQPRFGLGSLMLVILVCCMVAAAGRYLVQALSEGTSARAVFVIFVLTVPVLLLVCVNVVRLAVAWLQRPRL